MAPSLVYTCSLCGTPLCTKSIYFTFELSERGYSPTALPNGEGSKKWLNDICLLYLDTPTSVHLTRGRQMDDGPDDACKSLLFPQIPGGIGAYDLTPLPYVGVAFPFHHGCYKLLQRFLPPTAILCDIHEALSAHWRRISPDPELDDLNERWRWGHVGRVAMEYTHCYYGAAQWLDPNGYYWDSVPGWEWIVADPLSDAVAGVLADVLPRLEPENTTEEEDRRRHYVNSYNDVFARLPVELRIHLMAQLEAVADVDALQTASAACSVVHIPAQMWKDRVCELKVLWELENCKKERIDWRAILKALQAKNIKALEVFKDDPGVRNRVRIWWGLEDLVEDVNSERERRERGEEPKGRYTWCGYYDKLEADWEYFWEE